MKETLTPEMREAVVTYRMERARQTLEEADFLRQGGYFNTVVNRLYYACYYAASALLLSQKIAVQTHNGVKAQLSLHFVRTGLLDLEHGTTFGLLFDKRHSGDYSDFAYSDAALVDTLRPRAEAFINAIEKLITSTHSSA
ncbi:MAG: HEPN domain-containing protein [Prevotellaceae bacterium]|jgi:uncharacterized protein (UPF0332 family)|nr:HEPN domain-containing protein [Prevotellaceae bacterium]